MIAIHRRSPGLVLWPSWRGGCTHLQKDPQDHNRGGGLTLRAALSAAAEEAAEEAVEAVEAVVAANATHSATRLPMRRSIQTIAMIVKPATAVSTVITGYA